jgi:hypothetical protein
MTNTQARKPTAAEIRRLISKLKAAAEMADSLGVTTGNGGEVGSIVGSIADELQVQLDS